jgi:hypothetical protein
MPLLPTLTPADRPPARALRFWAGLVAFFLVWFALKLTYFYVGDLERGVHGTLGHRTLDEGTGSFYGLLLAVLLAYLIRRLPPEPATWRRWLPRYLAFFLAGSVAHTLLMVGTRRVLAPLLLGHAYGVGSWADRLIYEGAGNLLAFGGIGALIALADGWSARRERDHRAAELERSLASAQLRNLRLQLQPHFLFNALNAISERMYEDPAAADEMLSRLADLLRRSLATIDTAEVPLHEELALLEDYAALMQARFGSALDIRVDAAVDVRDAMLPPFLLQPLLENAVRHGNAARLGCGRIRVRASRDAATLVLDVEDDGAAPATGESHGLGVGLRTTHARLALLYGSAATVTAAPRPDGGYCVSLRLPWRPAAAEVAPAPTTLELADARPDRR